MNTSRFQLTLTTSLAVGLGAMATMALMPLSAIGYPASGSISLGSNPVQAWAGTVNHTGATVVTAPSDQDIVVTDLILSCNSSCDARASLTRSDGTLVGSFWVSGGYGSSYDTLSIQYQLSSGIPVPAGQSLSISTSYDTIAYTLSGYLAQP